MQLLRLLDSHTTPPHSEKRVCTYLPWSLSVIYALSFCPFTSLSKFSVEGTSCWSASIYNELCWDIFFDGLSTLLRHSVVNEGNKPTSSFLNVLTCLSFWKFLCLSVLLSLDCSDFVWPSGRRPSLLSPSSGGKSDYPSTVEAPQFNATW